MRAVALFAPLALALAACGESGAIVEAPAPTRAFPRDLDSLPSLPPGTIVAPLSLDLAGATAALERAVPTHLGDISKRVPFPGSGRKSFAFEVRREPFAVRFAADTILLAAVIHYKGRFWYHPPIGPNIKGGCGTRGEPPRARLLLKVVPRLGGDWRLRVRARVVEVTALTPAQRDQCEVSWLHVDVTATVLRAARHALEAFLPTVERRIARLDVRTPLERIWADLQRPIRLTDSLWLLLRPEAVNLGVMHGSPVSVVAELGVTASPRIATGGRPGGEPVPLPQLGAVRSAPGFSLLLEGSFDYAVLGAELTRRLAGHSIKAAGGELRVVRIVVYGVGGGRLALGLDFGGTASGKVWFLGKPSYDAASGVLSVPDLDFDATSAGMLVQGVAWLKADAIREFLRNQARISAGEVLGRIQAMAVKEMNRPLARGVRLSAAIERSEPAGILVRANSLIIRARATGTARLDFGPELFTPKPGGR